MINSIVHGDCLDVMMQIGDRSVDMVLCDLPFGVTARNPWDVVIPFEPLWAQYRRIVKENGAIVLMGQGLFSAELILSARDLYKYSLIWRKNKPRGHLNAKKQPLRSHEDILVFYNKQPVYNPQKTTGHKPVGKYTKHSDNSLNYGKLKQGISGGGSTERYPTSVIDCSVVNNEDHDKFHPTQKPVELGEYLIKTYTNPGDLVLDNACGSAAFCVAAVRENRRFIGIEKDRTWCEKARTRIVREMVFMACHNKE